jgi:hypothetical protein
MVDAMEALVAVGIVSAHSQSEFKQPDSAAPASIGDSAALPRCSDWAATSLPVDIWRARAHFALSPLSGKTARTVRPPDTAALIGACSFFEPDVLQITEI